MSEALGLTISSLPSAGSAQGKSRSAQKHPGRSISTLIIGPLGFYSEGLRRILEFNQFRNINQLARLEKSTNIQENIPKLVMLTGTLDNSELPEIVSDLRTKNSGARIVVFVDESHPDQFANAMNIPAHAFLSVRISPAALINALDVIFGDGGVLSINFAEFLTARHGPCEAKPTHAAPSDQRLFLSGREAEILKCLTEGISNKHIARKFGIAESTVKIHVKSILRKINVQNRTQAAIWALDNYPRPEQLELVAENSGPALAAAH